MTFGSDAEAPIGVFDSGIGGLSILKCLLGEMPQERFVYLADSGHAPYGERDDDHVIARSRAIISHLRATEGIKSFVVACNTATAAAVHLMRREHPDLPIVGVEPALKPAALQSRTRRIGVMATRGTLGSAKFRALLETVMSDAEFIAQPCDGLAEAIESECRSGDDARTRTLCEHYIHAMGDFGPSPGQIDTLVLGCTHYPFAETHLRRCVGAEVTFLEPGVPVARQTRRLLTAASLMYEGACRAKTENLLFVTTGDTEALAAAGRRWLHIPDMPVVQRLI